MSRAEEFLYDNFPFLLAGMFVAAVVLATLHGFPSEREAKLEHKQVCTFLLDQAVDKRDSLSVYESDKFCINYEKR